MEMIQFLNLDCTMAFDCFKYPSEYRDVLVWNKPCKNIVHSNKSDHHLSRSKPQLIRNRTIYYFFAFLCVAHVQLFTMIVAKIVKILPIELFRAIMPDEDCGAIGSSMTRLSICSIFKWDLWVTPLVLKISH